MNIVIEKKMMMEGGSITEIKGEKVRGQKKIPAISAKVTITVMYKPKDRSLLTAFRLMTNHQYR